MLHAPPVIGSGAVNDAVQQVMMKNSAAPTFKALYK
jgi:hypothetical protein